MEITSATTNETNKLLKMAKSCRHYSLCKVDILGCGVCASGLEKRYASFYPEGRMDLYAALCENNIPVTEKCLEIVDSCNLCGKCDYPCYFTQQLRPGKVMKALKEYVSDYLKNGGEVVKTPDDPMLMELKKIVGDYWAANDPAIAIAYHHDMCPHVDFKMPQYIVMPQTKEEIAAIIKLLNSKNISYIVRGNGASSHGLTFSEGVVLDLHRMNTIEFDEKNWSVKIGAGVTAFEVQSEAQKRGFRVNTAEPSATVCANIMTNGLVSTFSTAYGIAGNNFINVEFVTRDGEIFNLNDIDAPNLFSYNYSLEEQQPYAICVSVSLKLFPITNDEDAVIIPFESLPESIDFAKECAVRRIGLAISVLGQEFMSSFMTPTRSLAKEARDVFINKLGMKYMVLIIGDAYDLKCVREMGKPVIDQKLFKTLLLGLPSLNSSGCFELLEGLSSDEPFSYLNIEQVNDLTEMALSPSSSQIVQGIDEDLQPFFKKLFERPEMTSLVWLNTFRIISSRFCREKPFVGFVSYMPIDTSLIEEMQNEIKKITDKHGIKSELGFITPFDFGKRCVWEYDLYFDPLDADEITRIQRATEEVSVLIDKYCEKTGTIRQFRYIVNRGCCRMENLLYT